LLQGAVNVGNKVVTPHIVAAKDETSNVGEQQVAALPRARFNSTIPILLENLATQLEYELNPNTTMPQYNKVVLLLIEGFFFGMCGVDRCYAGQTCLGVFKGLTLGGLGVWAFLDWLLIMINCLISTNQLTWLGYNLKFEESSVAPAFWVALILCLIKLIVGPCHMQYRKSSSTQNEAK
jgi:TM2 domain-containing membrane protein YozV